MHGLAYIFGLAYYTLLSLSFCHPSTRAFITSFLTSPNLPPGRAPPFSIPSDRWAWAGQLLKALRRGAPWHPLATRWLLLCQGSSFAPLVAVRRIHCLSCNKGI